MDDMEKMLSSLIRLIDLDHLEIAEIEPGFHELKFDDQHLGYLSQGEKDLYLIYLFCEREVELLEAEQEKRIPDHDFFEEIVSWTEKKKICEYLLTHILRIRFNIPNILGIKVVEDFLVVSCKYEEKLEVFPRWN